ncbi:MAG: YifB family Mg chelatase-like AAA ATPase [Alcaligenaceae bacterium]|nr:YifB family Mg chelatase-like AAA ATPase [Alcaligenaceae bacterium]
MSLAILNSGSLYGLEVHEVNVEVHVSQGLPRFTLVGLLDTGVRESKERVRSAVMISGFHMPMMRVLANLAPADLPKHSGSFDLPIALALLLASAQIRMNRKLLDQLPNYYFAAELSLTGVLVDIQSPLIFALSLYKNNPKAILIMSRKNAEQAACVRGLNVLGFDTLLEVIAFLTGEVDGTDFLVPYKEHIESVAYPCFSDVLGQDAACFAMEVAASGGHGLLMKGIPGVGKTMLAERFVGILPELTEEEALDVCAIHSLKGGSRSLFDRSPPFRSPHHSSSMISLIGGGSVIRPGEISLAHHGVLFLDELPEFERRTLESLREPMERGSVHISRATREVIFPSQFQLLAAMNPCPCGYYGSDRHQCTCRPEQIKRYQDKLSGPLLDRIDMVIFLNMPKESFESMAFSDTSERIKARVSQVRLLQMDRQGCLNAFLHGEAYDEFCVLDDETKDLLKVLMKKGGYSFRLLKRLVGLSRTLADISGSSHIKKTHFIQAQQYRLQ